MPINLFIDCHKQMLHSLLKNILKGSSTRVPHTEYPTDMPLVYKLIQNHHNPIVLKETPLLLVDEATTSKSSTIFFINMLTP